MYSKAVYFDSWCTNMWSCLRHCPRRGAIVHVRQSTHQHKRRCSTSTTNFYTQKTDIAPMHAYLTCNLPARLAKAPTRRGTSLYNAFHRNCALAIIERQWNMRRPFSPPKFLLDISSIASWSPLRYNLAFLLKFAVIAKRERRREHLMKVQIFLL